MSNTQFAALASNDTNLTPAQKVKIFLSSGFSLGVAQPTKTLTLNGAIIVGATSIAVDTGVDVILYEGTRLDFGTAMSPKVVYVSTQTAAAATTIPIEASAVAIADNAVCTLKAWAPYFSAKTYSLDTSPEEISDSNFSDGLYMEKAIASLNTTGNMSGPWVYNDPGMNIMFDIQEDGDLAYGQVIYPGQRGGREFKFYVGVGESADRTGMIQRTSNMVITGKIGTLTVN